MTPDIVKKRIEEIQDNYEDDESAHSMEDDLYYEILKSIASGTIEDATECAKLAITTKDIHFSRWCA